MAAISLTQNNTLLWPCTPHLPFHILQLPPSNIHVTCRVLYVIPFSSMHACNNTCIAASLLCETLSHWRGGLKSSASLLICYNWCVAVNFLHSNFVPLFPNPDCDHFLSCLVMRGCNISRKVSRLRSSLGSLLSKMQSLSPCVCCGRSGVLQAQKLQPSTWSTVCRSACARSHAKSAEPDSDPKF